MSGPASLNQLAPSLLPSQEAVPIVIPRFVMVNAPASSLRGFGVKQRGGAHALPISSATSSAARRSPGGTSLQKPADAPRLVAREEAALGPRRDGPRR